VLFDNRAGASGAIGAEHVKNSPADGYTFLTTTTAMVCITQHLQPLPYDPAKDFVAVARTATSRMGMGINPEVPANNLQEFIAYSKANPGKINFGSAGLATITQLYGEIFNIEAGVKMVHVPYKGGAAATAGIIGGRVTLMIETAPNALSHARAGRLRALASSGAKRSSAAPELPTISEAGKDFGLSGYEVTTWTALYGPAGTPGDIVQRLATEMAKAAKSKDYVDKLTAIATDVPESSPEHLTGFMKSEFAKWARVVKESGARIE
jgi:tripartite-type tricarboxylate transporter receptor subunit TctC